MADDDEIKEAREEYERHLHSDDHNRNAGKEDLEFAREGKHWPEDIKKQREDEGRICLTINTLPAVLRQVVNDARLNSPTIRVSPADDEADVETAEIISDLIRNIEYTSDADVAYDTGVDSAASNGFGFWRVTADYSTDDTFDIDLGIRRIRNPFSVVWDTDSQQVDSSDWNVAFLTDRSSRKAFEHQWGKKAKVGWDDVGAWGGSHWRDADSVVTAEWWKRESFERKIVLVGPTRVPGQDTVSPPFVIDAADFADDTDLQAMLDAGLIEVYRERTAESFKVTKRIISGAEVLDRQDWPGRFIPIIPLWGDEFDIEGKVFHRSLIHDALDAARRYDYWTTAASELVALAPRVPFIGPKGSFASDAERWATANTQSHAYLEFDVVPGAISGPQRQPLDSGVAAGSIQQAIVASDDIKRITGLFDASMGARSNETSGKAIMARQREGDVSTFHYQDNQARAIRHTGRVVIDLLPHYYSTARIIRVRGEDDTERKVQINKEYPKTDPKTGEPVMEPQMGPDGQPAKDPTTGEPLMQAVMAIHDLTVGKYDVTVSAGPSFTTRRQEAAEQMMELIRIFPQAAPLIGDLIAKRLDWPGADEIAERLKKMLPPQALGEDGGLPPELKEFVEKGKQMIEILQKQVAEQAQQIQALKADKSVDMMNAQTKQFEAKTDRIETMAEIARPQTVPAAPPAAF